VVDLRRVGFCQQTAHSARLSRGTAQPSDACSAGKETQMTDESTIRNRLTSVAAQPVTTDSLVGSFFHADAERGWQGCVVAQPMPGVYLVELFGWGAADSPGQQVVRIEDMGEWTFYDTAEWMNRVYEHGAVTERWEREREQRRGEERGRGARLLAAGGIGERLAGVRPHSRLRDPAAQPAGLGLIAAFSGPTSRITRVASGTRRPVVLQGHSITGRGEHPVVVGLLGLLIVVAIVLLLLKVAVLAGILALIVIVLMVLVLLGRRI
jgi:hypothetical protein